MTGREAPLSHREADGNPFNYYLDLLDLYNSDDSTAMAKCTNVDSGTVPDGDGDWSGAAIVLGETTHFDWSSTSPVTDASICNLGVMTTHDAKRIGYS